mmetsp:Transcript_118469/g.166567  ORF Transcript_118469/g.166567 Transcript_118469/m.166567 type:complete len:205 (+) Transcript_118469:89-703(+)
MGHCSHDGDGFGADDAQGQAKSSSDCTSYAASRIAAGACESFCRSLATCGGKLARKLRGLPQGCTGKRATASGLTGPHESLLFQGTRLAGSWLGVSRSTCHRSWRVASRCTTASHCGWLVRGSDSQRQSTGACNSFERHSSQPSCGFSWAFPGRHLSHCRCIGAAAPGRVTAPAACIILPQWTGQSGPARHRTPAATCGRVTGS